ncbi:MAG: type IV pilus modification protein PilV [Methylomonas sp.]|nr:type IV pilus modification protein PilV [Methylomonas sp.]PPD20956.1 MAG: type IV pilus modification protein PilV [Methylomonas sp.]PPD27202.1 MAG: type IV pilus modification protein PilV [Methylomonas sp.]PPD39152.1 MAG: type IV pilus modification protein PilV [Methylomonas sp.]PPD41311.1 MAG: type IV pilus modification protein PilV [Methylomonas sp.]
MKGCEGFTLIEVLVAVIVLALGLLGLAGMQAFGLRNNQSAYNRSQATQLAYDIADRMRANTSALATYTTLVPTAASAQAACLNTTGCSPQTLAENDLFEWHTNLTTMLSGGAGTVTVAGGVYTITIRWDDDRDGNAANNPSFQTSFRL